MGQTLNRAARWTSADGGPKGKLEFYPMNELILKDVANYVESLATQKPEILKHMFIGPLSWTTSLNLEDFNSGGYSVSGDSATSDSLNKENQPLFSLKKSGGTNTVTILSLEYASEILKIAGEKKMAEIRACLEANPDPVAKICGERFTTVDHEDQALTRYVQEVLNSAQDDNEAEKLLCRVVLDIMNFDQVLMGKCIKEVTENVRLRPSDVEQMYNILRRYSGKNEESCVLEEITYQKEYAHLYANGCHAPPWRQIYGDICYLVAVPHDTETVHIVATTNGYFAIKAPVADGNFERDGEMYRDLIVLLRERSPKFSELIDQQDIFKVREQERERGVIDTTADLDGDYNEDQGQGREVQKANQREDKRGEKKKHEEKKKKLEPSLKWKNLGVNERKEEEKKEKTKTKQVKKRRDSTKKHVTSDAEDSFHESSSESEEEEETPDRRQDANSDLPSEYWQIQKLVKYLKGGNQTATIIALCSMRDFNLAQETCQLAIRDVGGLEVLINLLDTEEIKCKIGSLKILKEISKNTQIRRSIADLGGLQTMVKILRDPNKELKCLAAETIANVAKFRRARRTVRQHGGIKKLVGLLDCPSGPGISGREQEKNIDVARCGALALWSCSKSTENKQAMRKAGAIPLLAKLLKSPHFNMLIPVVGTLQECASEPNYRLAIRTEGMVEDLVNNLKEDNPPELQMHCASAIFKCAEEKETRDLVRQYGGLDPLVALLGNTENKELLAAATGAIWKCAISAENVVRFQELKAIELLVALLNNQPEEVLVNVVGALAELAQDPPNRLAIRKAGGIQPLVSLLTGTNQPLLINVTKAVGQCAEEPDNMAIIDKLDGVRLLWSLLKNQNRRVKASAAWAICPCIENAKDAGEMVRSFVGGLELIVGLLHIRDEDDDLHDDDIEVLASVCAAIAKIAKDEENLAVITDHNVVSMLSRLTNTTNDKLRRHLAEAIARCCNWGNNRVEFGREGAVAPLVHYLKAKDKEVHRSTARALFQLSRDPDNCITMHEAGVVKPLMEMVGSEDEVLQEAAAGCIGNIRRLALANEKARNK